MTTIETKEELEALLPGSVVRDFNLDIWEKGRRFWYTPGSCKLYPSDEIYLPAKVWEVE